MPGTPHMTTISDFGPGLSNFTMYAYPPDFKMRISFHSGLLLSTLVTLKPRIPCTF